MISYVFYIAGRFFTHWGSWNWISIKLLKCKLVYFMEAETQASCTMSMNKGVGVFDFAFGCTPTWQGLIALKTVKRFYFFFFIFLGLVQLLQSCPTLYDSMDWSLPGSSVHGIFQARILEWVVISSSRGSSQPRDWAPVSCISCIAGVFCLMVRHVGF